MQDEEGERMRSGFTLRRMGLLGTRLGLTVAVLLAGIGIGAGVASVIASHDTNTIHACLIARTGLVRIVEDPENCKRFETATQWNVQGPQGEPGPQGETGEQGETGNDAVLSDTLLHSIKCAAHPQPDIDWEDCSLISLNLSNTILSGAYMDGARLFRTNLSGADLSFVRMSGTDLRQADLSDTDLFTASLFNSNLTDANLSNADLQDAFLNGSDLTGADLTGVIWDNTTCPDGENSDIVGGTCINNLN
jgi:uncharacterized protein YjbI with pentapeptide repeats